jgi:molecular chaperone GrpE
MALKLTNPASPVNAATGIAIILMKNPFRRNGKDKKTMDQEKVKQEGTGQTADMPVEDNTRTGQADREAGMPDRGSTPDDRTATSNLEGELDILRTEHQALHDKHLRLFAEFDNFRKRTAKERLELIQFAGENTLRAVLPILDDMSRAIENNETAQDIEPVKEGIKLIHQKLQQLLASQGLKPMEVKKGDPFDTDKHEAITKAPAGSEKLKGAVLDVVESGYLLHDKVIRYAKVVVGE